MPRIPVYENTSSTFATPPSGGASPADFGAQVGAQVEHAGQVGQYFAIQQRDAQRALDLIKYSTDATQQLGDLRIAAERDTDWKTLPQRWKDAATQIRDQIGGQIDDGYVKAQFMGKFTSAAASQALEIDRLAFGKEKDDAVATLDNSLDTYAHAAARATNDLDRQRYINEGERAIATTTEHGYIDRTVGAKLLKGFDGKIDETSAGVLMYRDQPAFLAAAKDQKNWPNLDPLARERMVRWATDKIKSDGAIYRAEYGQDLNDHVAALRDGNADPDPNFSHDRIVAVYGKEKGERIFGEVDAAAKFGHTLKNVMYNSPEDNAAALAKETADLTGSGRYRADRQEVTDLSEAISHRNTMLAKDPAAFATQSPAVEQPYRAMIAATATQGADPATVRAAIDTYAEATLAEQRRLGVLQPRLLPKGYADRLVAQFGQQGAGGQTAAAMTQQVAAQWGRYWPQVNAEIGDKVPPDMWTIGTMGSTPAATRLAELAKLKTEDLAKGLDTADVKEARDRLSTAMEPLRRSFGGLPGSDASFERLYGSAEKLALAYVGQGMKPREAGERAAREVVMDRYEFQDGYRVPKSVDATAVSRGTRDVLREVGAQNLDLPASLAGLPEKDTREQYVRHLQAYGQWRTMPDESGLALYDDSGGAVTSGGKPIAFSWNELAVRALKGTGQPTDPMQNPLGLQNRPDRSALEKPSPSLEKSRRK